MKRQWFFSLLRMPLKRMLKANPQQRWFSTMLMISLALSSILPVWSSRIKDIARIERPRSVQIIGYGLVTGLNNSGDSRRSTFTLQSVVSMLKRFGVTVPRFNLRLRNVAAVMVTATIDPFMPVGTRFDVRVSSLGDARSLQGGVLLLTPLVAEDGTVYATAQGPLTVGGFQIEAAGSMVAKNMVNTAIVVNGGILEKALPSDFVTNNKVRIILNEPDFTTAARIAEVINATPNFTDAANAIDARTVEVQLPDNLSTNQIIARIAQLESLQVTPDPPARVVINERTGTVVVGGNVQLLPAVIAHGGLEIRIQLERIAVPPPPFTIAETKVLERATLQALEEYRAATPIEGAATVQEIADALNKLKVTPRDLIAIFQALKKAGVLQAELIVE